MWIKKYPKYLQDRFEIIVAAFAVARQAYKESDERTKIEYMSDYQKKDINGKVIAEISDAHELREHEIKKAADKKLAKTLREVADYLEH